MALESFYAQIPAQLEQADAVLTQYGRWAAARSAKSGTCGSVERAYCAPSRNYEERRDPREALMPALEAVRAQRAFIAVPDLERAVLSVLYVPRRQPVEQQLRLLRVAPRQCRERHAAGLRMFHNLWLLADRAALRSEASRA
jgi:hypothetical protein